MKQRKSLYCEAMSAWVIYNPVLIVIKSYATVTLKLEGLFPTVSDGNYCHESSIKTVLCLSAFSINLKEIDTVSEGQRRSSPDLNASKNKP